MPLTLISLRSWVAIALVATVLMGANNANAAGCQLMASGDAENGQPQIQNYAVTGSPEGDRLFVYLGNSGEAWVRFLPIPSAPLDGDGLGIGVQIDGSGGYALLRPRRDGDHDIAFMVMPKYRPVQGGLEWSLGASPLDAGRTDKLKELAGGRYMVLTYPTAGKRRSVRFDLGNGEIVYLTLGLREGVASGAMQNREDYQRILLGASAACSQNAVRQNWADCMVPLRKCEAAHPSDARQLLACAESMGVKRASLPR